MPSLVGSEMCIRDRYEVVPNKIEPTTLFRAFVPLIILYEQIVSNRIVSNHSIVFYRKSYRIPNRIERIESYQTIPNKNRIESNRIESNRIPNGIEYRIKSNIRIESNTELNRTRGGDGTGPCRCSRRCSARRRRTSSPPTNTRTTPSSASSRSAAASTWPQ